jgi:hypothetical protein
VEDKNYRPKSAIKEMFRYRNHITHTLEKLTAIESKRRIIEVSSGPLWYIFGYKLVSKPWLTYLERFDGYKSRNSKRK